MSSGGQGDFEESYEEQESDDDDHEKTQVSEPIDHHENDKDCTEEITTNHTTIEKAIEKSSHILKKVPSVQLTVVNRKRDRNEKIEKEMIVGKVGKIRLNFDLKKSLYFFPALQSHYHDLRI